ncbi:MAG: hypothetical protein NZ789_04070, partial [Pseudomonadales bacterium]|nr:hypothetical protein [Pseudomonadales bacterium]
EITCLPGDLPEYIEVDVAEVEVGGSIHMSKLTLPQGLVIPSLQLGPDHDHVVVSVNAPKRVEEIEEFDDAPAAADDADPDAETGDDEDSSGDE